MTNKEQETIDKLYKLMSDIRTENINFREGITKQVEDSKRKVDQKHLPVNLAAEILSTAQSSIQVAIKESLTKYDSPLIRLVKLVVDENASELKQLISESFQSVIRTEDFKKSIVDAFSHKVARTVISNNDGLFDKVSNELKQDSLFKAKMQLAVANVVNECLIEKSA